jgi:hypothetical protein
MSATTARTSELPPSVSLRQTRDTPDESTTDQATSDRVTPENCTCGARLAERARFCHMCGRPVFEPEIPEATVIPPTPLEALRQATAVTRAAPLPVNFSNPVALRVAFLMSLAIMLMTMIPVVNFLSPVWWLVAGSCAVLLYRRMTGLSLSVKAGARLGSITGVLAFLSLVVIIGLTLALTGNELFQEMVRQNPDASQVLNNPPALVLASAMALVILFAMVVGMCAAGGALGARFAGRNAKV